MADDSRTGGGVSLLTDASKSYVGPEGRRAVFTNLTLDIRWGRRLAIVAPNASGKSTLLRALLGIEPLDSGEVRARVTEADRRAAVLQDYRQQLVPWASVATNLLIAHSGARSPAALRAEFLAVCREFLDGIGYAIDLSQRAAALSGGQQQAIVLARALGFGRGILVWDEPTSALDVQRRLRLHHWLRRHFRSTDPILVLVTHDVDEALALADEAVLFGAGLTELMRVRSHSAEFLDLAEYRRTDEYRDARAALSGWV